MRLRQHILYSIVGLLCTAGISAAGDVPINSEKWTLVWSDEFDGETLDLNKWSYQTDCWGGGNEERQCYTVDPKNISVGNGLLSLTAHRGRTTGHALPVHLRKTRKLAKKSKTLPYSSGRIRTLGKGDWRYGRFDIRAKLPAGQGAWPAIWMLPSDEHYGGWAASGEIDIMEAINLGTKCEECEGETENRVHGTLHYGGEWPENKHSGSAVSLPRGIDEFYTYSIVWSAGVITWYVDGKKYARQTYEDWHTESGKAEGRLLAPFDQRFHMLLNLAIGGKWPEEHNEKGVNKNGFPKSMQVDYVRVYQCASDPENGLDCISF